MHRHIGTLAAAALLIPTVVAAQSDAPAYAGEAAVLSVANVSSQAAYSTPIRPPVPRSFDQ